MERRSIQGVHFIRVRGSAAERAKAHASLLREEARKGALPYLARKNEGLIRKAPGALRWKPLQDAVVRAYYDGLLRVLARNTEPEMRSIVTLLSQETGLKEWEVRSALFQADGLMLLSRLSMMRSLLKDLPGGGLPGCSSAITLSGWGQESGMLAARNQDYPVVGVWEPQTTVVFHEPSESEVVPHVSVTTAGVHTSGLTTMNAEGLLLFAHAHFGRKVSLRGKTVVELGTEIATRAKTLGQAIDIARRHRRHANWAFVVGSAKENDAAVIEMTPSRTEVHSPTDGLLTHSNFFHHPEMQAEEANLSGGCSDDLISRLCRLREVLRPLKGKLTPAHLTALLGDHVDPLSGEERVFGNTVSVITTIKSVVFDPTRQRFWISSRGESPMGLASDFLPVSVESFWKKDLADLHAEPRLRGYEPKNPRLIDGVRAYREAYRIWHTEAGRADTGKRTLRALQKATEAYPEDAHLWIQRGILALRERELEDAARSFHEAGQRNVSEHARKVISLYRGRVLDLQGSRAEAKARYEEGLQFPAGDPKISDALREGLTKAYAWGRETSLMIDLQFPDTFAY
jgi:hypothetical protein